MQRAASAHGQDASLQKQVTSNSASAHHVLQSGYTKDIPPESFPYLVGMRVEVIQLCTCDTNARDYSSVLHLGTVTNNGRMQKPLEVRLDDGERIVTFDNQLRNLNTFQWIRPAGNCKALENGRKWLCAWLIRPPRSARHNVSDCDDSSDSCTSDSEDENPSHLGKWHFALVGPCARAVGRALSTSIGCAPDLNERSSMNAGTTGQIYYLYLEASNPHEAWTTLQEELDLLLFELSELEKKLEPTIPNIQPVATGNHVNISGAGALALAQAAVLRSSKGLVAKTLGRDIFYWTPHEKAELRGEEAMEALQTEIQSRENVFNNRRLTLMSRLALKHSSKLATDHASFGCESWLEGQGGVQSDVGPWKAPPVAGTFSAPTKIALLIAHLASGEGSASLRVISASPAHPNANNSQFRHPGGQRADAMHHWTQQCNGNYFGPWKINTKDVSQKEWAMKCDILAQWSPERVSDLLCRQLTSLRPGMHRLQVDCEKVSTRHVYLSDFRALPDARTTRGSTAAAQQKGRRVFSKFPRPLLYNPVHQKQPDRWVGRQGHEKSSAALDFDVVVDLTPIPVFNAVQMRQLVSFEIFLDKVSPEQLPVLTNNIKAAFRTGPEHENLVDAEGKTTGSRKLPNGGCPRGLTAIEDLAQLGEKDSHQKTIELKSTLKKLQAEARGCGDCGWCWTQINKVASDTIKEGAVLVRKTINKKKLVVSMETEWRPEVLAVNSGDYKHQPGKVGHELQAHSSCAASAPSDRSLNIPSTDRPSAGCESHSRRTSHVELNQDDDSDAEKPDIPINKCPEDCQAFLAHGGHALLAAQHLEPFEV